MPACKLFQSKSNTLQAEMVPAVTFAKTQATIEA